MAITTKSGLKQQAQKYILEYYKCKKDFHHFCKNYIYIELPGQDELLIPYAPQKGLIDKIDRDKYVLVLKSRQIGISTIVQAYICWLVTFYRNVVIGVVSKDGREATDFSRFVRGMFEKLPRWMKPKGGSQGPGFAKRTEQSFILTNGSKIYATPVNPNGPEKCLRGKAITFLVIDEAAFVDKIDEAWTSMVSALATNQKQAKKNGVPYGTIILSTPNKTVGKGKWFYERYMNSIDGGGIFKQFIIHWRDVKELADDPDWYNTQCAMWENDQRKINQELELKFLGSEGSFFEEGTIEALQEINQPSIETLKIFNGEIWKFQNPVEGRYYITGVDTAPEHGEDKSAIVVFDYQTMEQVWEFQGKCKVLDFAKVVQVAGRQYPGLLVIENNSYGNQVVETINESDLSYMLYQEKKGKDNYSKGLNTNSKTRPLMIDALYSYVTEFPESIKSKRLAMELVGLVSKPSGRVEADTGCHDDLGISAALCFYVRKYDAPLLIDRVSAPLIQQEFQGIMNMNDDTSLVGDMSNSAIMKHIKGNMNDFQTTGMVDILGLYNNS